MSFFNNLNKVLGLESRKQTTIDDIAERSYSKTGGFGALFFGGSSYTNEKALNLSAVYRAVNLISDSVAKLPLEPYKIDGNGYKIKLPKHPTYSILNKKPNVRMTRFTFLKLMVSSMLLRGNAYAYILRGANGNVEQLIYIPSEYVTIIPPQFLSDPVTYSIAGIDGKVEAKDLIHLINYTVDGVVGISTLQYAHLSLGLASDAEAHARGFYSGGCNVGGVLKVQSSLTEKQKRDLKNSWTAAFNKDTGTPNSVAILEGNMDYSPISINPKDSQLIETREFNVIEIARWFSVNPVLLYDLSKSSYSTVEAVNMSFLTDTLQPILEKIENEFETKLFAEEDIEVKFDVNKLLRADKNSLASYYTNLFNIGVMSPNEIRKELDLTNTEEGNNFYLQSNLMTMKAINNNIPANSAIKNTDNNLADTE